jgi:hypothetical protein
MIAIFRVRESTQAMPLDLRSGAAVPSSSNTTSIGIFYPPPPPPPPIQSSCPEFVLASGSNQSSTNQLGLSAILHQTFGDIRVMRPLATNPSESCANTCSGISPIPISPRIDDLSGGMSSPLLEDGNTEQGSSDSVLESTVENQPSNPIRLNLL